MRLRYYALFALAFILLASLGSSQDSTNTNNSICNRYLMELSFPDDEKSERCGDGIYVLNIYDDRQASITIRELMDWNDAGRESMVLCVKDILEDFNVDSNTINTDESLIDQCYGIVGNGNDPFGNTWIAACYWLDRNYQSGNWVGKTKCSIVSNYDRDHTNDMLGTLHIVQRNR